MPSTSRRGFLRSSLGLAAAGLAGYVLRDAVPPTESSGSLGAYAATLGEIPDQPAAPAKLAATEDNILGPYYRKGAPFRAKITPPLEPGKTLLIAGRVWAFDTKKPLPGAVLDIWQANADGRYDNDDPQSPPKENVFLNRARLITDETGYYEYETIIPGRYRLDPKTWRPAHIHYLVRTPRYKQLVTQLYFKGDPHNDADEFIKKSLIIDLTEHKLKDALYYAGTFDIVLAPT